ncbi:MAG: hypothetical protein JWN60_2827 [Acidobacteria bacterium]|jgi:hypothetical protein|nr:hypothetical protein [Acidobacteriota bacterium]
MNAEVELLQNEPVIFQTAYEKEEILENKNIEGKAAIEPITVNSSVSSSITAITVENRFARLKRSLRRRSVSIL